MINRRIDEEIAEQNTQSQESSPGVWILFGLLTSLLAGIITVAVQKKEEVG